MKIFADKHHESLSHSLKMLFEDRLGWELYFPIGMDWWTEGFWKLNNLEDTAKQYLEIGNVPKDGTVPLADALSGYETEFGDIYKVEDYHNHSWQKAITLDTFKKMKFDVLLASVPQHIDPFRELIRLYQPQAKLIFQMGNHFDLSGYKIDNLLSSTLPFVFQGNSVFYHQEFDLRVFKPSGEPPKKKITSFINCLRENAGFQNFYELRDLMPDYEFFSYGGQNENGSVVGVENMAHKMQESAWGFHVKWGADGYGHVLHNFFAVGTPVIINYEEYRDKLGGLLTIPEETCIIANVGDNMQAVAEKIRSITPIQYEWMRQRAYDRFLEVVDFDREEKHIRKFLERLI